MLNVLKEALLVVIMTSGTGNSSVGSESVTVVNSMDECRVAMRVFRSTKGKQYDVVNQTNSVKFTQDIDWDVDRKYELQCVPLVEGSSNPTQEF